MKNLMALTLCLLLGTVACKEKTEVAAAARAPAQAVEDDGTLIFAKAQALVLTETNQVSLSGANLATIEGQAGVYKLSYTFNSGSHTAFEIFESSISASARDCEVAPARIVLQSEDETRNIQTFEKLKLRPDTSYVLEIEVKNRCPGFQMKADLTAWIGSASESPSTAWSCEGEADQEVTIMPNSRVNAAAFCGEAFQSAAPACEHRLENLNSAQLSKPVSMAQFQCSTTANQEARVYKADLNLTEASASIACYANGLPTSYKVLTKCRPRIVNL